jgi:hypothetical protein
MVGLTINNQQLITYNLRVLNNVPTTYSSSTVAAAHSYSLQSATQSNPQSISHFDWGFVSVCHYRTGIFLSQREAGVNGMERSLVSPQTSGSHHCAIGSCSQPGAEKKELGCGSTADSANIQYAVFVHSIS